MKIIAPFNGSRQQVLARYYHVAPKPKKVPLTHGQNVAKQIAWRILQCLLGLGGIFLLLWLWPVSQRLMR